MTSTMKSITLDEYKMRPARYRIIAIDDEANILLSIKACLPREQYHFDSVTTASEAFIAMPRKVYDCALIDIRLHNENGIELFKKMQAAQINTPVIFMSGNASLNEAAESQKLGAYDFLEKPFSKEKLQITINNCLKYYHLKNRLNQLEKNHQSRSLIGEHISMIQLKNELAKVSVTNAVVLIQGESGTGKELIANEIHQLSVRRDNQLVTVNCSAIPDNLVESALFGHKKGAFTGATESTKGYFEQANKGSIFLDEIGDMPLPAQASLLRVLETSEIQKVGSDSLTKVDVRIIAATHKNLKEEVEKGNFRQDLYYRISVIPIQSPALRERLSDLPQLTHYLIKRLCQRHGLPFKKMDDACLTVFAQYNWPGNIRELTNALERMVILGGEILAPQDIPSDISFTNNQIPENMTLKACRAAAEREVILSRLKKFNGNISQVARSLDIDRTNLHKKLKQYQINRDHLFS